MLSWCQVSTNCSPLVSVLIIKTYLLACVRVCVCVCVPVGVCVLLQVDQQGGDDLLHVTRLPDVHLQLIIHRLPDDTLKTTDPRHTDPEHTHTHTHTHTYTHTHTHTHSVSGVVTVSYISLGSYVYTLKIKSKKILCIFQTLQTCFWSCASHSSPQFVVLKMFQWSAR